MNTIIAYHHRPMPSDTQDLHNYYGPVFLEQDNVAYLAYESIDPIITYLDFFNNQKQIVAKWIIRIKTNQGLNNHYF